MYINLIHEYANALRRITAKAHKEYRKMPTPPESQDSLLVFDESYSEQQSAEIREELIFGEKVKEITSKAAVYFLQCSADLNHEDFKNKFAELLKERTSNPDRGDSARTIIGRCLFSGL